MNSFLFFADQVSVVSETRPPALICSWSLVFEDLLCFCKGCFKVATEVSSAWEYGLGREIFDKFFEGVLIDDSEGEVVLYEEVEK